MLPNEKPPIEISPTAISPTGILEYELVTMSGPDCGAIHPLAVGSHSMGRSPAASICLDDPTLSPHHGLISWHPPVLTAANMGGAMKCAGSVLRLGQSRCEVRAVVTTSLTAAIFYRHPLATITTLPVPIEPKQRDAPSPPMAPPIAAFIAGVVMGLLMAMLTGQVLFALFSVTTAVIAGMTWGMSRLTYAKATKRFRIASSLDREMYRAEFEEYIRTIAERRRQRHRTMGELIQVAETGAEHLWAQRDITQVGLGFGISHVDLPDGGPPLMIEDAPDTIDISAGQVVGVFGRRAGQVVTAMLSRLAVEVGPADWQLIAVGDFDASLGQMGLSHLGHLPQMRRTPLDRHDLGRVTDGQHRLLLVTQPESMASRTSIPRRVMQHRQVSVLVMAPTRRQLPALCTFMVDSDQVHLDGMSAHSSLRLAKVLQQWVDPELMGSSLPNHVAFAKLLESDGLEPSVVIERWSKNDPATLRCLMGESSDGVIDVDFDHDGPHAVIVGTTGSGKSEYLRTLILSMATYSSPAQVNFILIDYKGGAAFDACADLPHVVGVITDLETGLAARVLLSLEAEIRYRERWRRDEPDRELPRLVVVVDELAALKEDVPEFIGALVAIAQRGRSLGIHLIVATQRPGSALSADVLANANIRLALRVQSAHDSLDIVGSNIAAQFSRDNPGRAALRLGVDDLFIFQTAFVGSTLAKIVEQLAMAHRLLGLGTPRRPWLDPLPKLLDAGSLSSEGWGSTDRMVLGMIDDPRSQQQWPLIWESSQHLFLAGAAKSGKSSTLRTIIDRCRASATHGNVFSITCAGQGNQITHNVDVADRELLKRLLKLLIRRLDGPNLLDDKERWTLVVDDIDIWRNHFVDDRIGLECWDMFERILLEGPSKALTCVVSGAQLQALPPVLSSRVRQVWRLTTGAGRMTVDIDDRELEAQIVAPENIRSLDPFDPWPRAELRRLPANVDSESLANQESWAIAADDFAEVSLPPSMSPICVIGHGGSGRSMVICSMTRAWSTAHPLGVVIDLSHSTEVGSEPIISGDVDSLIIVDDVETSVVDEDWMRRQVDAPSVLTRRLSIIVGATPGFMRAHGEHWINSLRRSRTGLLLGNCADTDADLLGVYSVAPDVYGKAVGRGLWIKAGVALGIVQSASAKFETIA